MLEIDLYIFALSFFIGTFFVYVTAPKKNVIVKYPTLENINELKFFDNENNCIKYEPKEIECPKK